MVTYLYKTLTLALVWGLTYCTLEKYSACNATLFGSPQKGKQGLLVLPLNRQRLLVNQAQ